MNDPVDKLLRDFGDATKARPGELARVERALEAALEDHTSNVAWLPTVAAPRRPMWWAGVGVLGAAAALALVWLIPRPAPDVAVQARLEASGAAGTYQLGEFVRLDYTGNGGIQGSTLRPVLDWESGSLRVEVDPEAGIDLSVRTREGSVQVVGTVFRVERGATGTEVLVERGRVQVVCEKGSEDPIPAEGIGEGERAVCLPTTAAGLLGRARALHSAKADTSAVLASVEAGLETTPSEAVGNELKVLRITSLAEADRSSEALDHALDYLDAGANQRRAQVLGLADALITEGGCDEAATARLAAHGSAAAEAHSAACADGER